MDKIIFYEPYFKPQSRDINENFTLEQDLYLSELCVKNLSAKEINLTTSLLKKFNITNISYLIIHTIGCDKRIVFETKQKNGKIAHIFLIDYYVHKLIEKRKEKIDTYTNLCKVLGLGTLFGVFSYLKN
jgi:hypothetical protein